MSKEIERLKTMLKDNKISESDYTLLTNALNTKSSSLQMEMIFNPFTRIAGMPSLWLGLCILIGMSYFGLKANVYFFSIFGCTIASAVHHPHYERTFSLLLAQNLL